MSSASPRPRPTRTAATTTTGSARRPFTWRANRARQGIGAPLLEALVVAARDRGLHKLTAKVFAGNESSLRLFERGGLPHGRDASPPRAAGRGVARRRRPGALAWDLAVLLFEGHHALLGSRRLRLIDLGAEAGSSPRGRDERLDIFGDLFWGDLDQLVEQCLVAFHQLALGGLKVRLARLRILLQIAENLLSRPVTLRAQLAVTLNIRARDAFAWFVVIVATSDRRGSSMRRAPAPPRERGLGCDPCANPIPSAHADGKPICRSRRPASAGPARSAGS